MAYLTAKIGKAVIIVAVVRSVTAPLAQRLDKSPQQQASSLVSNRKKDYNSIVACFKHLSAINPPNTGAG